MNYVAGEEAMCVYRLKVKDAITLGGTASCGVEVDSSFISTAGLDLLYHTLTSSAKPARLQCFTDKNKKHFPVSVHFTGRSH